MLLAAQSVQADPPALREQVLLNGASTAAGGPWSGGQVPDYWGITIGPNVVRRFERSVTVPAAWTGKQVKLHFGGVNYIANVYINGAHVKQNIGAWMPFEVDITERVAPGSAFTLRIDVKGMNNVPFMDGIPRSNDGDATMEWPAGIPLWPIGYNYLDNTRSGIVDDIWMRAYGAVHIEDAFVQTSFRNRSISVKYSLKNSDSVARTFTLRGEIVRPGSATPVLTLNSAGSITLNAGARTEVTLTSAWANPLLYWPDQPELYHLNSSVRQNATVLDQETRRFGFREIWVEGAHYMLNGIRVNFRGDYFETNYLFENEYTTRSGLRNVYRKLKNMHTNIVRWHKHPPAAFALELADEEGMLIISESAMYGSNYHTYLSDANRAIHVRNCLTWIEPWVKATRNHPSVVLWSAVNEMTFHHLGHFTAAQVASMGERIREFDRTRPIIYEGDKTVVDSEHNTVTLHYPEGYQREFYEPIYSTRFLTPGKATGVGETLSNTVRYPENYTVVALRGELNVDRNRKNTWWKGHAMRGMRHVGFAHIAPKCYAWAKGRTGGVPLDPDVAPADMHVRNIRNSNHAVALFDHAYDGLGIDPLLHLDPFLNEPERTPIVDERGIQNRELLLYNDEYRDTAITAQVEIRSPDGSVLHASGARTFQVALGTHIRFPYSFQAPAVGSSGGAFDLVLITRKGGREKFREEKRFRIRDVGVSGATSAVVTLGDDPTPPPTAATPRINPNGGVFNGAVSVTLSTATAGAAIRYTLDGTAPGATSPLYTAALSINRSLTVKARAFKSGYTDSAEAAAAFTANRAPVLQSQPVVTPNPALVGGDVNFTAAASDADGDALTYAWNFGDGTAAAGAAQTHPYAAAGTYDVELTVRDGRGGAAVWRASLTIEAAPPPLRVRINFQPAGAATPGGYLPDSGAVFGARGDDYEYGWNADNRATARDRNSPAARDQRYDTLQHLQKPANPNAYWELALPNGAYTVRVVAGDPSFTDSVYKIAAEGVLVVNATPTATSRWAGGTRTVSVNDGRLTLSNAAGAVNNKICFVEISSAGSAVSASESDELVFAPLTIHTFKAAVNSGKQGADRLQLKAEVELPADLALQGLNVGVDIGGAVWEFSTDAKGQARSGAGTCKLKLDKRRGVWIVTLSLKGGGCAAAWDDGSLLNGAQPAAAVPAVLTVGGRNFGGQQQVKRVQKGVAFTLK